MKNIEFSNFSYKKISQLVETDKEINSACKKIAYLDKVILKDSNDNDELDNFQVFTPKFIVDSMIYSIGKKEVINNENTILEPTSGDGAFTCRILELRLKNNLKNKDSFLIESLKSLSTIYSIELDKKLIERQRNNIYSIFINFLKKNSFDVDYAFYDTLKLIVETNFIWGMTNISGSIGILLNAAYKMPQAQEPIEFPVWNINKENISLHYEAPEIGE